MWVMDHHCDGTVVEQTAPRSYQVSTPSGPLCRNCCHLIHCPNTEPQRTEAREEDTTPTELNASQQSPTPEGTVQSNFIPVASYHMLLIKSIVGHVVLVKALPLLVLVVRFLKQFLFSLSFQVLQLLILITETQKPLLKCS